MKSHNVRFWEIRPRETAKGQSWTVRWTVAARENQPRSPGKLRRNGTGRD